MNTFIEENKGLLKNCYVSANVLGWLLLALGCSAVVGHSIALISRLGDWTMFREYYFSSVPWNVINGVPIGLLALGIGQFIKFICDKDYQPGRILRNAQQILYIYAVLFAVSVIIHFITRFPYWENWLEIIVRVLAHILWGVGKIMLLVALALILKRIMPVIEESRTLV